MSEDDHVVGTVRGVELAQLRALVVAVADLDDEASVNLALRGNSSVRARLDHPDLARPRWLTVTDDAVVLPGIGPAAAPRRGDGSGCPDAASPPRHP
ncbi:MAG TPA: hypothetical protein VEZ42_15855 [Pseudonocardia sp.]|nr:hypothetical protein [Pseudonocardia sp.]